MRRTLLTLLGVALLAGCSATTAGVAVPATGQAGPASGSSPVSPTSTAETEASQAKPAGQSSTKARFVVLATPDGKPIDIANAADTKKKYLSGLKPGSVSDYVEVPRGITAIDSQGKPLIGPMTEDDTKFSRVTLVIGMRDGGSEGYFFPEQDGKIQTTGTIPADRALLVSIGLGLAPGGPDNASLKLAAKAGDADVCVPALNPNADEVESAGNPILYNAIPGPLELTWHNKSDCQHPVTKTVKVTVEPGKSGYVFPLLADSTHFRFLFVPITADRPGDADVVDSGVGPAY
jgi:hypothetical protein